MRGKITLTKRNYLGEGWVHIFKNDKTGDEVVVECTEEEYKALALPNPTNPTLEGHTWTHSAGGTVKVDSPTSLLSENEYCEIDGKYTVVTRNSKGDYNLHKLDKEHIINDELAATAITEQIL